MIHELDHAVRNYAETRLPRPLPVPLPALNATRQRHTEGARLGIRDTGRAMHPAAIRVLETTWRVWREPLA